MLDIEVIGLEAVTPGGPTAAEVQELCALALSSAAIEEGHVAVDFVDEERIRDLNREHRRIDEPTDVLSFGVDEDGPGVQRPRDALTERMQRRVERELEDADGCLFVVNAEQGIGPGDRFIARLLAGSPVPVVIAANKTDRSDRPRIVATLQAAAEL